MFAFRSWSAVTRVRTIRRPLAVCSVVPRSEFSAAALLHREIAEETSTSNPSAEAADPDADSEPRIPLSIQSVWYRPFRRKAEYGLPVCDLQIRSYSVRNLEFMCDFALRAAYYLNLPASGPVPLPRKTERWTVPRGHFVHKKSQENFERVTYKRLIQIKDGHPETVEIWLAYLKKHQFYGTGMKANVWGFEELGVGKRMNVSMDNLRDVTTKPKWAHSGVGKTLETAERAAEILNSPEYRALADKTDIDEARRELLQAAPLETIESLGGASEAEVDEAIQKVEEEAIQKVEDVPATTASPAAEVAEQPPAAQTQEEIPAASTLKVIPSEVMEVEGLSQDPPADQAEEPIATFTPAGTSTATTALAVDISVEAVPVEPLVVTPVSEAQPLATEEAKEMPEATSAQGPLTRSSEAAAPAREQEPQPEAAPQDSVTTQTAPEVSEAQKAEAEVEMEIKKAAEETAADRTTREDASEPNPEKKD